MVIRKQGPVLAKKLELPNSLYQPFRGRCLRIGAVRFCQDWRLCGIHGNSTDVILEDSENCEGGGTRFAGPTQLTYLSRDADGRKHGDQEVGE
jgi:hypothetical protein